jgi:hypothetical protein
MNISLVTKAICKWFLSLNSFQNVIIRTNYFNFNKVQFINMFNTLCFGNILRIPATRIYFHIFSTNFIVWGFKFKYDDNFCIRFNFSLVSFCVFVQPFLCNSLFSSFKCNFLGKKNKDKFQSQEHRCAKVKKELPTLSQWVNEFRKNDIIGQNSQLQ